MSASVSTPPAPVPVIPVDNVVNCVVNEPEKVEGFPDESVAVPKVPSVAVTPEAVFCNCSGSPLKFSHRFGCRKFLTSILLRLGIYWIIVFEFYVKSLKGTWASQSG